MSNEWEVVSGEGVKISRNIATSTRYLWYFGINNIILLENTMNELFKQIVLFVMKCLTLLKDQQWLAWHEVLELNSNIVVRFNIQLHIKVQAYSKYQACSKIYF